MAVSFGSRVLCSLFTGRLPLDGVLPVSFTRILYTTTLTTQRSCFHTPDFSTDISFLSSFFSCQCCVDIGPFALYISFITFASVPCCASLGFSDSVSSQGEEEKHYERKNFPGHD